MWLIWKGGGWLWVGDVGGGGYVVRSHIRLSSTKRIVSAPPTSPWLGYRIVVVKKKVNTVLNVHRNHQAY